MSEATWEIAESLVNRKTGIGNAGRSKACDWAQP